MVKSYPYYRETSSIEVKMRKEAKAQHLRRCKLNHQNQAMKFIKYGDGGSNRKADHDTLKTKKYFELCNQWLRACLI